MNTRTKKLFALALLAVSMFATAADDTVRIVVPYAPGGGMDITARKIAQYISKDLNSSIVVENMPGAGTSIATASVIKSIPNGKTILINSPSALESSIAETNTAVYNWQQDLRPLAIVAPVSPMILVANKKYKTLEDFVQALKSRPVNFGSATNNGVHVILVRQLLKELNFAGVNAEIAVYKSSPTMVNDVMSGQLDAAFVPSYSVYNLINENKLSGLAIASSRRVPFLQNTPTFVEKNMKKVNVGNEYYGLWVPSQTPSSTVTELQKVIYNYVRNNGDLHKEFVDMNFIDPHYTIPVDPTVDQNKYVSLLQTLQREFIKK